MQWNYDRTCISLKILYSYFFINNSRDFVFCHEIVVFQYEVIYLYFLTEDILSVIAMTFHINVSWYFKLISSIALNRWTVYEIILKDEKILFRWISESKFENNMNIDQSKRKIKWIRSIPEMISDELTRLLSIDLEIIFWFTKFPKQLRLKSEYSH